MHWILLLTQYFTRIPVKRNLDYSPASVRQAMCLSSLHAAFVALIPLAWSQGLRYLRVPSLLNALLTLTLYLILTGAFHLDGFADTLDGLFSGRSRERILEIMKDPTMGSYGTAGIFLNLAMKSYILYQLIDANQIYFLPLLAATGKFALVLLAYVGKRAKENSSANLLITNIMPLALLTNVLVPLAIGFAFHLPVRAGLGILTVILVTLLFNGICRQKINGLVGDNLGFIAELAEIIIGIFIVSI